MSVKHVNNKPYLIGLTGGIGSGKTTASNYLKSKGFIVVDSDQIVRELYQSNPKMVHEIESITQLKINSSEDKKKLADLIFKNQDLRSQVNQIIHPLVYQKIDQIILKNINTDLIIIDMPLLFEVGYQNQVDDTILIYIPKEIQKKRIKQRNPNLTYKEIEARIDSQMPLRLKKKMASFIIDNRSDKEKMYQRLDEIIRGIRHEKQQFI